MTMFDNVSAPVPTVKRVDAVRPVTAAGALWAGSVVTEMVLLPTAAVVATVRLPMTATVVGALDEAF